MDFISEYERDIAPARGVNLSLIGFKDQYAIDDRITYVDFSSREVQSQATPEQVLDILVAGNKRFANDQTVMRASWHEIHSTSAGQFPLAVVLSCMDSRVATERIFDLGLGDAFSIRVAGNIVGSNELGSIEYGCAAAGAKLLVVLGHTGCGAVGAAIEFNKSERDSSLSSHLTSIVRTIQQSVKEEITSGSGNDGENFASNVTERNVRNSMKEIIARSEVIHNMVERKEILLVGGVYDVNSGEVSFFRRRTDAG